MLHLLHEERAQRARLGDALLERERELAGERGKRQAAEQAVAQWQRAAQVAEHALKQESARRGAAEVELARISTELARLVATAGGQQALAAAAAAAGQQRLNAQAAEMAGIVAREQQIEAARLAEAQEAREEASRREMEWHAASGAAGASGAADAAGAAGAAGVAGAVGAAGQSHSGKGWLAAKAEKHRQHGRRRRPGSGSAGHPRLKAPSRPRTAVLWAARAEGLGPLGPLGLWPWAARVPQCRRGAPERHHQIRRVL